MKYSKQILLLLLLTSISFLSFSYPGEEIRSFEAPGNFCTGITFDGEHLWIADRKEAKLFCINPQNGEIIRSIPAPGYWPMGLAWDGKYLWNVDVKGGLPLSENYDGKAYKIDPKDGTVLKTIPAPTSSPYGLTWDGKYLWCTDNGKNELIQFSPEDGTTIRSLKAPGHNPQGITWDGSYLWVSDRRHDELYMVHPGNAEVLILTDSPGPYARGVCFDNENLWVVDYQTDKIYQLKAKDEQKIRKTNEHKSLVTFNHRITNFGPGKVLTADVYFGIPLDRPNQKINTRPAYSPGPGGFVNDKWGFETAHFHYQNIEAGEQKNTEMKVEATTWDIRYFIFPDEVGSLDEIPQDISGKFLENHEKYQYDHPLIQKAVKEAVGSEKNPYWIARKIYNYLMPRMYYEMTGGWNTAPTVLERGNGSCSEYTFVYIAMCRAAGLPARYVGSVVIRGDYASLDDVYHRWVEVYLPNYGWVPVDPSGGDSESPRHRANYFGALANRFLITTESGGGSETMTWTYNSNEFYTTEPKTNVCVDHFAEWEPVDKNKAY
ncbi:MAG: hypothetical protein K9G58_11080 [Bacteroidales bacterium]|nr:hypothetical protein [Bacteroidales bacterium]MCF8398707.1 hypothetical protein [Bacteroidales bacterium]